MLGLQNPIGEIIEWDQVKGRRFKILGVVKDMVMESPYDPVKQTIFHISQGPSDDVLIKINPKVKFLRYSGLWGSLGSTPFSSGYWGPVFNETGMKQDGFLAAWCDGFTEPGQAANSDRECYADDPQ